MNDALISAVIDTMPGTNHCSAEPVPVSGSSGANRREEHQRLDHREQDRRGVAEHRHQLADEHVADVGDDPDRRRSDCGTTDDGRGARRRGPG